MDSQHAPTGDRPERMPIGLCVVLALQLGACGAQSTGFASGDESPPPGDAPDGSRPNAEPVGQDPDAGITLGVYLPDAAVNLDDSCPESAKLVYVTGQGSELWSLYPPDMRFSRIGTFDCLQGPTHMTVDRQGAAWVVSGGRLYKASTETAKCSLVPTWKSQSTFSDFSLTFIGTQNTVDNSLYILSTDTLAKFDIATGVTKNISKGPVTTSFGDMTSNGDGSLYFLHDVASPTLYKIAPSNGAVLASMPIAAVGGGTQALAFWGGRFYAFENNGVYEYDPAKKSTKSLGSAPLRVTGAGQSTCVPKDQPPPK